MECVPSKGYVVDGLMGCSMWVYLLNELNVHEEMNASEEVRKNHQISSH